MSLSRREFVFRVAGAMGASFCALPIPAHADASVALRKASSFLSKHQSIDGAWRSTRYGFFRDGDALTPLVLWALLSVGSLADSARTVARGLRWLETLTTKQTSAAKPWIELRYPLFTASYSAQIFAKIGDGGRAAFWADLVERLRIDAALGWAPDDAACGAWSDAPAEPQLPAGSSSPPDMLAPNISATLLGLHALLAVGRTSRCSLARSFIEQCQNFGPLGESRFNDGGFFFALNDSVRNKAGVAGHDLTGERYRSYGSATCDGLLSLKAAGFRTDHPRIVAAIGWLQRHVAGARHGANWPDERADERESLFFYHAQALAEALSVATEAGLNTWAEDQAKGLVADLLAVQEPDGEWAGQCANSFEDDPLVATPFALRALSTAAMRPLLSPAKI